MPTDHASEFTFAAESDLSADEFIDVLRRSTLAERRPVGNAVQIAGMLAHADVLLTARTPERVLVGVSRAITDFHYCTYLSDLAVDQAYQRRGIGKRLIEQTHVAAGTQTTLVLLSAPAARAYYPHIGPHIGMKQHESCWTIRPSAG